MNVFIVGTPYYTASVLDKKRLHKQVIECRQILSALEGKSNAWRNHPCTIQYEKHKLWLMLYMECLASWLEGDKYRALIASCQAHIEYKPYWHTEDYFDQMKRRLFTKDSKHYAQWAHLGTSEVNWYFVEGEWRYYENGKRINI